MRYHAVFTLVVTMLLLAPAHITAADVALSDGTELRGTAAVVRGGHDHHDH